MGVEYEHPTPVGNTEDMMSHPAYGQITLTRPTGQSRLYGSDFTHNHFISLTISTSQEQRAYGNRRHYQEKQLIEVHMSEAQWSHLVSAVGQGSGAPCTLKWYNGENIPQIPVPVDKPQDHFKKDLDEVMGYAHEGLDEILEMLESAKLSKTAKDELRRKVDKVRMNISQNAAFVHETIGEYMEKTVSDGKAEIEAYGKDLLIRLGQESADLPLKLEDKDQ